MITSARTLRHMNTSENSAVCCVFYMRVRYRGHHYRSTATIECRSWEGGRGFITQQPEKSALCMRRQALGLGSHHSSTNENPTSLLNPTSSGVFGISFCDAYLLSRSNGKILAFPCKPIKLNRSQSGTQVPPSSTCHPMRFK